LAQDRLVAEREGLANLRTVEGDAADLSMFADESFDLIFNPVSTVFMADVRPVWQEAFRVLRPGGTLLAGVMNPIFYIFDIEKHDRDGLLEVRYAIPFSDLESMGEEKKRELLERGIPLEFGHSLTDLLAGQTAAGFHIIDLYEDVMPEFRLSAYHPVYIATRALKP
jgi:SAM-dependent methyltransferase